MWAEGGGDEKNDKEGRVGCPSWLNELISRYRDARSDALLALSKARTQRG